MEEVAGLRRDVGRVARPHRYRQEHDVHGGEAGDGERADELLHLAFGRRLDGSRLIGPGGIAEGVELVDEGGGLDRALADVDADSVQRVIDARARHARQRRQPRLDGADAAGAVDALDGEVEMGDAVAERGNVVAEVGLAARG